MKKYFTYLNLIFVIEVVVIILASLGLIPRQAVLFLTGLMILFVIFASLEDALWLVTASIPIYVALPITKSFDTMASWRILVAVLFLCLFFKQGVSLNLVRNAQGKIRVRENLKHYGLEYLVLFFLILASFSILVANYQLVAIKQILFLANIFLLFLIARNIIRSKQLVVRLWRAAATGGVMVLAVAMIQFIVVLFVPLISFWQFWPDKVINIFYGQNLANLLSYANTWFAYYAGSPPTLRLFSVFPDSHSFAMFCILITPVFLTLAIVTEKERRKKVFYWIMAGLASLGIVFSGSRGAWLGAVPAIVIALYFYFRKIAPGWIKKILLSLTIFILLFLVSSFYPPLFYKIQAWQAGTESSSTFSFFERARSIYNLTELSNKGRLEIWTTSLRSIINHPLLGVGLGNYVTVLEQNVAAAKMGASAHSLYLDFASETGVAGGLILIALFANIFYTAWLVFNFAKEPRFKIYGLIFGIYFLWVAAYSFFDIVLLNDKVLLLLMINLATLYSIRNIELNPEKI